MGWLVYGWVEGGRVIEWVVDGGGGLGGGWLDG